MLIQDGDLEYDPDDYERIMQPILEGRAQVVYGSRFLTGVKGMHWQNWLANKILAVAANILFRASITDEATAYKAFHSQCPPPHEAKVPPLRILPRSDSQGKALGISHP